MKILNQKAKQMLREPYEKSCNDFLLALIIMWHWDNSYGYWVGNDVGGVYAYGDDIFIGMSDIIYCVENDVEEKEYEEWQEYCVFAHEYDQTIPNFPSWHKGCPRLTKEQQDKLVALKKNLNDCIKEYKGKLLGIDKQSEKQSTDNLTQQEVMDIAVAKCFNEQEKENKL